MKKRWRKDEAIFVDATASSVGRVKVEVAVVWTQTAGVKFYISKALFWEYMKKEREKIRWEATHQMKMFAVDVRGALWPHQHKRWLLISLFSNSSDRREGTRWVERMYAKILCNFYSNEGNIARHHSARIYRRLQAWFCHLFALLQRTSKSTKQKKSWSSIRILLKILNKELLLMWSIIEHGNDWTQMGRCCCTFAVQQQQRTKTTIDLQYNEPCSWICVCSLFIDSYGFALRQHKHKQCAGSSIEARTFAILSLARGRRRQWRPGRKWSAAHTQWQVQCVHISRLHFTDKPNTTNGQIPQTITWPLPFHQRNVNSLACSGVHLLQPCLAPKRNKAKIAQIKRDILPAFNYRIAGIVW